MEFHDLLLCIYFNELYIDAMFILFLIFCFNLFCFMFYLLLCHLPCSEYKRLVYCAQMFRNDLRAFCRINFEVRPNLHSQICAL